MGTPLQTEMQMKFADAYAEAANAGAAMRAAANALETIRETLAAATNPVAAMGVFDEQVGRADAERLMPALVKLRKPFEEAVIGREVSRLKLIAEKDRSKAWAVWVKSYVECFGERGWYTRFGWILATEGLASAPVPDWSLERIRECAKCVFQERWPEAYDWFLFLAGQELTVSQRAGLLVSAAEVQLYHFQQPTKARKLLEQAQEMAPDGMRVWAGLGEFALQQNKLDEARGYYERILRKAPELADGFVGLGDYYSKAGKPDAAEDQYQQAIMNAPGNSAGYERLIDWYGRPNFYKDRQDRIEPLIQRWLALGVTPAVAWTRWGVIHRQNRVLDKARECFQQAINLDGSYINGRAWLGYTYLDENRYDTATDCFQAVTKSAPRALDGYWGLSTAYLQKKDWQASLEWCDQCLSNGHHEWESFVRARRGNLLQALDHLAEAEADLLRSLELEPDNPSALDFLSQLADAYKSRDRDAAFRLLEKLRELRGETYEASFQNLAGHVWYYYSDYARAAECYRKAAAADPDDAVLHSNLALALEQLRTPGQRIPELEEAMGHLRRARELKPEIAAYSERLNTLETERRFLVACGEDASKFATVVTPIFIESNAEILGEILDASGNALSAEGLAKTNEMRRRVQREYGVTLPGVLYGQLPLAPSSSLSYQITIMEADTEPGYVGGQKFAHFLSDEGSPAGARFQPQGSWVADERDLPKDAEFELWTPLEWVLRHLQHKAEGRLGDFLGHQEVATLLDDCKGECAKTIRNSPVELTAFVQVLRALLNRPVPIVALEEICSEFSRLRGLQTITPSIIDRLSATFAAVKDAAQRQKAGVE